MSKSQGLIPWDVPENGYYHRLPGFQKTSSASLANPTPSHLPSRQNLIYQLWVGLWEVLVVWGREGLPKITMSANSESEADQIHNYNYEQMMDSYLSPKNSEEDIWQCRQQQIKEVSAAVTGDNDHDLKAVKEHANTKNGCVGQRQVTFEFLLKWNLMQSLLSTQIGWKVTHSGSTPYCPDLGWRPSFQSNRRMTDGLSDLVSLVGFSAMAGI